MTPPCTFWNSTFLRISIFGFRIFLALVVVSPASGDDTWSDPYHGIRHLHRTSDNPKWNIHALVIDLGDPGIKFAATPPDSRKMTVSAFAEKFKVQAAINADFFSFKDYDVIGLASGMGKIWPDSATDDEMGGFLALGAGNKVELSPPPEVRKPEPWMRDIVGGRPQIVDNGRVLPPDKMGQEKLMAPRHPRTAVGLTRDKRSLILLVVDGRQPEISVGMTGRELGDAMVSLGAWSAMNLDGGGSTAMWVQGRGIVNSPSDKKERVVANHLGVFARAGSAKPKGAVRGTVRDRDGAPVPGAKVTAGTGLADVTGDDGGFHITQAPPGTLTLTATDGARKATAKVRVEAGKTATADLTLGGGATATPSSAAVGSGAEGRGGEGDGGRK